MIQNPHFIVILLPSDWESKLQKIIRVCMRGLAVFMITLLQILFCYLPYTREHEHASLQQCISTCETVRTGGADEKTVCGANDTHAASENRQEVVALDR